jgi:hypothetical protein
VSPDHIIRLVDCSLCSGGNFFFNLSQLIFVAKPFITSRAYLLCFYDCRCFYLLIYLAQRTGFFWTIRTAWQAANGADNDARGFSTTTQFLSTDSLKTGDAVIRGFLHAIQKFVLSTCSVVTYAHHTFRIDCNMLLVTSLQGIIIKDQSVLQIRSADR